MSRGVRLRAGLAALLLGGLAALGIVPAPAAAAGAEEQAAAIARPAVLVVEARWHGWVRDRRSGEVFGGAEGYRVTTSCTGFAVHADGYLVTAGHCVDPGPEGIGRVLFGLVLEELAAAGRVADPDRALRELHAHAVLEGAEQGSPVTRQVYAHRGVIHEGEHREDTLPAEVVEVLPVSEGDVAVITVPRGRLPALALSEVDDLPVGTPVLALGYPGSANQISDPTLEPSVKDGVVSNRRTVSGIPFYEVSAAATGGMSGGPVIDHDGYVIGLVSHGPAEESQAFNFVAAATSIRTLLERNQVPHELSAIDRNYRSGLARYFAGDDAAARPYFEAVLAASPTHQQAAEFLARIDPGSGGWGSGPRGRLLLLLAGAGAGMVAVVAAMAGLSLLLVRAPGPPAPRAAP